MERTREKGEDERREREREGERKTRDKIHCDMEDSHCARLIPILGPHHHHVRYSQAHPLLHGFRITFVNIEHNHQHFLQLRGAITLNGLNGFPFEATLKGQPPYDGDAPSLYDSSSKGYLASQLNKSVALYPATICYNDLISYLSGSPPQ